MNKVPRDTLRQMIRFQEQQNPDAIALRAAQSCLTLNQLAECVDAFGRILRTNQLARSDRVAVVLPNGPAMAVAFLGVASWATCAPLNPAFRSEEFRFYLGDLDAKAIVLPAGTSSPARDVAASLGLCTIELDPMTCQLTVNDEDRELSFDASEVSDFGSEEDVAIVLHTSGTTSRPKLVPLSHRNLLTSARNVADVLQLSHRDCCLNVMPLFHIHGLVGALLSSLSSGASVVCSGGFDSTSFPELLHEFKPTWYTAVPTIHQSVLALARADSSITAGGHLRLIRSSSSALPPTVMRDLEDTFSVPVLESYGMTEAAHQMASSPLPPGLRKAGSVGLSAGPDMGIMDEEGNLLDVGATGEIVIRGANVTAGYADNPDANKTAFTDGWFRTGDLGRIDEDGYFLITGRKKEMINRGGENISPREIDEALMKHSAVSQAVAFAVPHASLGEDVVAAVVCRDRSDVTPQELREFAFSKLAEFKVPSQIVFVEKIPKGPTGKLQRIGLFEKLREELQPKYLAPQGTTERSLAELWTDVLELAKVGRRDNFFSIGGDSLMATRLVVRIDSEFGVQLALSTVFRQPTLQAQADLIDVALTKKQQNKEADLASILDELEGMSEEEARYLMANDETDNSEKSDHRSQPDDRPA